MNLRRFLSTNLLDMLGHILACRLLLEHLYVHPDLQCRGIGSALLSCAKQRMPGGFRLWVFQQNAQARRFYERHGLRVIELTEGAGDEEQTPDALYEWRRDA